jgi:hypothetical protein
MYEEPVSMSFASFDRERIRISSNGDHSRVLVDGSSSEAWFERHAAQV